MSNSLNDQLSIDVTSFGSYVFCPRAGIIAFARQGMASANEEGERVPDLTFLPDFSIQELKDRFEKEFPGFVRFASSSLIGFVAIWLIARFGSISLSLLIFASTIPFIWLAISYGVVLLSILLELYNYKVAVPAVLNPSAKSPIALNWYDLIKAGYTPWKPQERLEDRTINLTGQPWRILQSSDGARIPVLNYSGSNFQVRDSHTKRLALYSHLCTTTMRGSKSEWGIVLDVKTKQCFAVPINQKLISDAILELGLFEQLLLRDRRGGRERPSSPTPCENCRLGKPRLFIKGETETFLNSGAMPAFTQPGSRGTLVHSDCGDYFEWTPPHRDRLKSN